MAKRIIISRTDSIGDTVLTLPLCGYLKKTIKDCEIIFFCKAYTKPVVEECAFVDACLIYDEEESQEELTRKLQSVNADAIIHVFPRKQIARAAKNAKIGERIGTSGRLYHVYNCNKLVKFSRKRSDLHESQLNFKLLKGLKLNYIPDLSEIPTLYGLDHLKSKDKDSNKIILHPGSRGSAADWSPDKFAKLAEILINNGKTVYITGSESEGEKIRPYFKFDTSLVDVTGKYNLKELMTFISNADALVAASTGPLHIAAALDVKAVGLYVDLRPIHPGRWAPVGPKTVIITPDSSTKPEDIQNITPEQVSLQL